MPWLQHAAVIVGEAVHAVAGRHVAVARAPERKRVDDRFAQHDLLRRRQRLLVPHAAVRPRQVQVRRRAGAQIRRILRPYRPSTSPAQRVDGKHHRAVHVLVARGFAQDAEPLQTPAQLRAGLAVVLRQRYPSLRLA